MSGLAEPTSENIDRLPLGADTMTLLGADDTEYLDVLSGWHRGGNETYVTDFLVRRGSEVQHLIAKACVKFGPREALQEWLQRRQVLASNGVNLPNLVAVDEAGATLVEEFIPYTFKEAYGLAAVDGKKILESGFKDVFKRVYGAGFSPQNLHDVRSHGHDVVVIDVGADIGGYVLTNSSSLGVQARADAALQEMLRGT